MSATTSVTPEQIGRAFVVQYYRILHEHPEALHRFYSFTSTFTHDDPKTTVTGSEAIAQRIAELAFKQRSVRIRQVDCHAAADAAVVVQVEGEISAAPVTAAYPSPIMRAFVETFTLTAAEHSKRNYYVQKDLFRYRESENSPVTPNSSQETISTEKRKSKKARRPVQDVNDSWCYGNGDEGYLSTGYIDDQEVFVGNLSAQVTERDIHQLFRPYGSLLLVRIGNTGSQVGAANFAFVVCQSIEMAQAIVADREALFRRQKIRVEAKKRRPFPHTFRPTYPTAASPTSYRSTGYPAAYYHESSPRFAAQTATK